MFSDRITVESKVPGRKLKRIKETGSRASNVISNVEATSSFLQKCRIEKIGGGKRVPSLTSKSYVSIRKKRRG